MTRKEISNGVLAAICALLGGGFASGREIMGYFSRYGWPSWVGIFLASATIGALALYIMSCTRRAGIIGRGLMLVFLAVTGVHALFAAGELVAIATPIYYAYEIGIVLTLLAGLFLMRRNLGTLASVGKVLVPLIILAFVLGLFVKAAGHMEATAGAAVLPKAFSYGALKMALLVPLMREIGRDSLKKEREKIAYLTALVMFLLLALGNAVLLAHPELQREALPMVQLLRNDGLKGFYLSAVTMYLAVFGTFLASLRGIYRMF